jgi:hypothetical protein
MMFIDVGEKSKPWFRKCSYINRWSEGVFSEGSLIGGKWFKGPTRGDLFNRRDVGFETARVRMLVKDPKSAGEKAEFESGGKICIVAEDATVGGTITPSAIIGGCPTLKVHGVYGSLKEANKKAREIAMMYVKWHNELAGQIWTSSQNHMASKMPKVDISGWDLELRQSCVKSGCIKMSLMACSRRKMPT